MLPSTMQDEHQAEEAWIATRPSFNKTPVPRSAVLLSSSGPARHVAASPRAKLDDVEGIEASREDDAWNVSARYEEVAHRDAQLVGRTPSSTMDSAG